MCFNWTLKRCLMCQYWTLNSTNVCSKCTYMLYDYTFHSKNSFSDFGEYNKLK